MAGGGEDCVRLSRLGRLPPSTRPDLSLPSWNEGILISQSNNNLDAIHPIVDRHRDAEELGSSNAFLQAQLAAERIAAARKRREDLQRKTEQRSKAALTELKKQNASNPKAKLPWSRAQPKQRKFQPRLDGAAGLCQAPASPQGQHLQGAEDLVAPHITASTAERLSSPGKENGGAPNSDSLENGSLSPSWPRSPPRDCPQQAGGIASPGSSKAVWQPQGMGKDVLFQPTPEQPEIEDVASELVEPSEILDGASDSSSEDSDHSEPMNEELLLPGEMDNLTIRDGIADVPAQQGSGGVPAVTEGLAEGQEAEEELPWIHPLRDLPTPRDFDSSLQLVGTAGQRARMNLARYASKSVQGQESTWHDEQDDILDERKPSPINQQSPYRTVVHRRDGGSDDDSTDQDGPTPRQKTPEPTRRTTGLREELHKKDRGAAAFPLKMKNRPAWWASARATYEARAKSAGITLPSLCNCSTASPLDPNYPALCSRNCPLYQNPMAWEAMAHSLLQTYQLL